MDYPIYIFELLEFIFWKDTQKWLTRVILRVSIFSVVLIISIYLNVSRDYLPHVFS